MSRFRETGSLLVAALLAVALGAVVALGNNPWLTYFTGLLAGGIVAVAAFYRPDVSMDELLREIIDNFPGLINLKDTSSRYLLMNQFQADLYGTTVEDAIGKTAGDLISPEYGDYTASRDAEVIRVGHAISYEETKADAHGKTHTWYTTKSPLYHPGGRHRGVIGVVNVSLDITILKETRDALQRNEERYRLLFDANPQPMWVFDRETLQFLAANDATVHTYGYSREELVGSSIMMIRPQEEVPKLKAALEKMLSHVGYLPPSVWRHKTKAGRLISTEISAYAITFDNRPAHLVLASDVTQRLRLEEQLRQAQKMDAVGQMAGGIAHDFNNLLTALIGNLGRVQLPEGDANRLLLDTADRAAQRAAELTRKLLGFARRSQLQVAPVRPNDLIREAIDLVRPTLGPQIEVITELAAPDPVMVDAGLLSQALVNLCLNARDAMPDGGQITLSARPVMIRAGDSGRPPDVVSGRYLRLAVSDTGVGIPPDLRPRLFEPFFTTKPVGQGTGLGLAMVHGIIQQHRGWVECDSEPGRGTRFHIYVPFTDPSPVPDTPSRVNLQAVTPLPAGRPATILLVDDEGMIRDLGRAVLQDAGYQVIEAADGAAAVQLFETHRGEIDLVIMDMTMPEMSGREAQRAIAQLDPTARVLFSSGYSADDASDIPGAVGLLSKPYRPADLVLAVRRVMAGLSPTSPRR